ncbi:hypothetical protein WMF28_18945 [Sorangium sp. So ce590]|uniref:hypothetical protein n=1 Tax=Sorangium sp. So ce590 TaxID=3133317 RepID=UPI003F5F19EF
MTSQHAQLEYTRDISYDKALQTIAGEISLGVGFPTVKVEGKAEYANTNSATEYRETHTLSFKYLTKRKLTLGSLELSESGRRYSTSAQHLLHERCKNEFVNEINVGLTFLATMSIEFKNKEDKERFAGSLKVDVLAGTVQVEGSLAIADEKEKKSVRVTLSALQDGGDARQLASILRPEVASCDASNLAPCVEGFRHLISYGTQLPQQIAQMPATLKIISYHTASYADSGLDGLVAGNTPEVADLTLAARERIEDLLRRARKDHARASSLLGYGELLSPEQHAKVAEVQQAAFENRRELTKALIYCFENPYMTKNGSQMTHPCSDYASNVERGLRPIDRTLLEIKGAPSNAGVLCEAARLHALRTGALTQRQYDVYQRINYAPEYAVSHDRSSEIIGWGECENLVEQL